MNHSIPDLLIRIHQLDGSALTFVQDDVEKSKQILDGFQPMEIFNCRNIFLADGNSHTAFPASQITRIDFESEEYSHQLFESGLVEAVELTREEFETLVKDITTREQWENLGEQDAFVVAFLSLEMAGHQQILLTMEVDAESPQGLCELRDFILGRPALCFRMRSGGIAVLNLANLARLTFFPGTLQPPPDTWPVHSLDQTPPIDSPDATPQNILAAPVNQRHKLTIQKRL